MMKKLFRFIKIPLILGFSMLLCLNWISAQNPSNEYTRYHTPDEINSLLGKLNKDFPGRTSLTQLAVTPAGNKVMMLEIGPDAGKSARTVPAILVVGNPEGDVPISGEATLFLADLILNGADVRTDLTWYIVPMLNPDAFLHYFNKPLQRDTRNAKPHNDDMDDRVDEDGFNDLDGNGIITQMRVVDPLGEWIPIPGEPRLMKRADGNKGEVGIYKLYTEGVDDDGDGKYNEDGPGGVNIGITFPHLYKPNTATGGAWPGSENETFEMMKFVYEHPEIAMTFAFGSTNFCMVAPRGGRKGTADMDNIKIPERYATMFNADPDKSYSMEEIMEMVRPMMPAGMEVSESMIASFLGLGAVVNPLREDLAFYNELNEKYKEFLKEKDAEPKRLAPQSAKDGSFELWSYYNLGVPSFSMDLWTLPEVKKEKTDDSELTIEKLESMSNDEFVALGEEKITAFLKESGAPPQYNGAMVINMVKSGQLSTKQMAGMMKQMGGGAAEKDVEGADPKEKTLLAFSDESLNGKGFVDWKEFDHPTLGKVEIGGAVPYVDNTPPESMIDSLLTLQVPWVFTLVKKLPELKIVKTETKSAGSGVHELTAWIRNSSYLPFPTAMGGRNQQPAPAILVVKGDVTFLSGKPRTTIGNLEGNKSVKLSWIIQAERPVDITLTIESKNVWGDQKQINIGGVK